MRFYLQWILIFSFFTPSLFAGKLGQMTIDDPILGPHAVTYERVGSYAITEDDIILGRLSHIEAPRASIVLPMLTRGLWNNGIIPFEISEELPLMNKLATLQAMSLWQQKTNVQFVELNMSNQDNYPDYIEFVPAGGTTCASYVGKQKGRQVISLAPRCNAMNTVHEIGHALGLWHEQSRSDRDAYIQIKWENIDENHRYNFEQHLTDGKDFGEYDYQSVMHYPGNAFSKNGEKTIVPLVEGVEIGQRDHISDKDIAAVNAMYP